MTRRKDGRWVKKVTLPNGKSKYFYSSELSERKAARDIDHQLLAFAEKKEEGSLFRSVADAWERDHSPDLGFNTACKYARCLKKLLPFFGNMQISEIDSASIDVFLKDMKKKGYAKDTVSIHKSVLSQIFDFAILNHILTSNPCSSVSLPKDLPKTRRESASQDDVQIIISSVDKHFGLYAFTALLTGLRREELIALTSDDINLEKRTATINKAVIWTPNQPQIVDTKTESSDREIYLPSILIPHLRKKKGYIFGNGDKPMTQTQFRRAYNRYRKETGLTVTSHQLRHCYASMLYDAEVDVKTAQSLLGHAKASTTQDIYTHIWESRQKRQMSKMETYISDLTKSHIL